VPGKFGSCLSFDEADDYIIVANSSRLNFPDGDWSIWFLYFLSDNSGSAYQYIYSYGAWAATPSLNLYMDEVGAGAPGKWHCRIHDNDGTSREIYSTSAPGADSTWHILGLQRSKAAGQIEIWLDGKLDVSVSDSSFNAIDRTDSLYIGRRSVTPANRYWGGLISQILKFNRALSIFELAWLCREPFCMFERASKLGLIGGPIVNLAGTLTALSSLSATAKAIRKVGGTVASTSNVAALLNSICGEESSLEIERSWLREALFNGMTASAFKLGTTLSLGWFWVRVAGCSVLYRGPSMERIDFTKILTVAEQSACEISPPSYIPHNNSSIYFYVVRRFSNCGYQELTLAAAAKVSIDASGELEKPQPSNIFNSKAEQVDDNKIQLVWFYCPLEQKSQPVCFNVYYDGGMGQIDYENPLTKISYEGRRFYSYQSGALGAGGYLFTIRAEDADGIENSSSAQLKIQLDTSNPDAIDILSTETV